MLNAEIFNILDLLKKERGFDFMGNNPPMLERRINKRLFATNTASFSNYLDYLSHNPTEFDLLIDILTINVSEFFRDPYYFETLAEIVVPEMIVNKQKNNDQTLRIWSAGCACGQEAYSIAIIIHKYLKKEGISLNTSIFATDIDQNALAQGRQGSYNIDQLKEVKFGILEKYFHKENEKYLLDSEIRNMVNFYFYDLLNLKSKVPEESIFGDFDIVFCRNVLIYFNLTHQQIIFEKIYNSLNKNGVLVLGKAESAPEKYKNSLQKINKNCKIYKHATF